MVIFVGRCLGADLGFVEKELIKGTNFQGMLCMLDAGSKGSEGMPLDFLKQMLKYCDLEIFLHKMLLFCLQLLHHNKKYSPTTYVNGKVSLGSDDASLAISGNSKGGMWGTAWIYNMADSLGIWGLPQKM